MAPYLSLLPPRKIKPQPAAIPVQPTPSDSNRPPANLVRFVADSPAPAPKAVPAYSPMDDVDQDQSVIDFAQLLKSNSNGLDLLNDEDMDFLKDDSCFFGQTPAKGKGKEKESREPDIEEEEESDEVEEEQLDVDVESKRHQSSRPSLAPFPPRELPLPSTSAAPPSSAPAPVPAPSRPRPSIPLPASKPRVPSPVIAKRPVLLRTSSSKSIPPPSSSAESTKSKPQPKSTSALPSKPKPNPKISIEPSRVAPPTIPNSQDAVPPRSNPPVMALAPQERSLPKIQIDDMFDRRSRDSYLHKGLDLDFDISLDLPAIPTGLGMGGMGAGMMMTSTPRVEQGTTTLISVAAQAQKAKRVSMNCGPTMHLPELREVGLVEMERIDESLEMDEEEERKQMEEQDKRQRQLKRRASRAFVTAPASTAVQTEDGDLPPSTNPTQELRASENLLPAPVPSNHISTSTVSSSQPKSSQLHSHSQPAVNRRASRTFLVPPPPPAASHSEPLPAQSTSHAAPRARAAARPSVLHPTPEPTTTARLATSNPASAPAPPREHPRPPPKPLAPGGVKPLTIPRDFNFETRAAERDEEKRRRREERERERQKKEAEDERRNAERKRGSAWALAPSVEGGVKRQKLASSTILADEIAPARTFASKQSSELTKEALDASAAVVGPKPDLKRRVSMYLDGISEEDERDEGGGWRERASMGVKKAGEASRRRAPLAEIQNFLSSHSTSTSHQTQPKPFNFSAPRTTSSSRAFAVDGGAPNSSSTNSLMPPRSPAPKVMMKTSISVADDMFKRTQARILDRENWERKMREKEQEGKKLMELKKKQDEEHARMQLKALRDNLVVRAKPGAKFGERATHSGRWNS